MRPRPRWPTPGARRHTVRAGGPASRTPRISAGGRWPRSARSAPSWSRCTNRQDAAAHARHLAAESAYYASLANFYTVHDLRNLKPEQTHLYLLCYAWLRYRQLTDNLVDAMAYHMKQLEDESSAGRRNHFVAEQVRRQQETPQVGRLLSLYVDDSVADATPFGDVRQRAYKIMPKRHAAKHRQRMSVKPASKLALHWQAVDGLAERMRRHCGRCTSRSTFAGAKPGQSVARGARLGKGVFAKQQRLSQRPLAECPATLPKRLRPYLLTFDADGKPTGLHADRYEFWLYRQIRKRFQSGELYLDDSLQHRISPTSWSRWTRRPTCSHRWTSRSCASRSRPSSMR
jgi:hypothetical protein